LELVALVLKTCDFAVVGRAAVVGACGSTVGLPAGQQSCHGKYTLSPFTLKATKPK